ncbi:MAG: hypothetical protein AB1750_06350 [Chloroflexota bacterium]
MKKQTIILLIILILIVGCQPSADAIQTAIAQTQAAIPTATFTASLTSTITRTPTNTPTITFTPSATPTATLSPTATPSHLPGTLTKQAYYDNATQRSAAVTQTVAAQYASRFATETAAMALYLRKLEYHWISVRELTTYADKHIGEKVTVQGYIREIFNDTQLELVIGDYPSVPIWVFMEAPFSGIYPYDYIRVYGTVAGWECPDSCIAVLKDAFWEPREGAQ